MEPTDMALVLGVALVTLAALVFGPGLVARAVARGEPPTFLGPLFWAEWQRLNRRGSQLWLRTGYVGVLLLGLFGVFATGERVDGALPLHQVARLAERYFFLHLGLQFVALTVVTPVFVGASIFEEQERRTLDLLLSSLLTRRELVMGKVAARVAFVLGLAAAGLPVLAVAMHFGGVDGPWLVCGGVVTVFYTAGLAALIFCFATRAKFGQSVPAVLAATYVASHMTVIVGSMFVGHPSLAGVSPFTWLVVGAVRSQSPVGPTLVAVAFNSGLAVVCGLLARPRSREVLAPRRVKRRLARRLRVPRLAAADPLVWKEKYFTVQTFWAAQPSDRRVLTISAYVGGGCVAVCLLFFLLGQLIDEPVHRPLGLVLAGAFGVGSFMLALGVPLAGLLLTACVTRERQKQTLETLLSLPCGRDELLAAKWQVIALFLRPVRLGYAVAAGTVVVCLAVHPVSAALAVLVLDAGVRFFLALGLWLSVRCRSTIRAVLWCLAAAFAAFLGPVFLSGPAGRLAAAGGWPADLVADGVASASPVAGAVLCLTPLRPGDNATEWGVQAVAAVVTAVLYLTTSVGLWRHACRTFGRDEWS